jgi:hypothetical protein
MRAGKAAAWKSLVVVVIAIYLPRWHALRLRRRLERLVTSGVGGP